MTFCKNCTQPIKKYNKFCNSSCAASYNNTRRVHNNETKIKISNSLMGRESPLRGRKIVSPKLRKCMICQSEITMPYKICKSDSCRKEACSIAGKKSAQSRKKRSKDEIKLFELCSSYFKNVSSNQIIADGWDADIVINDKKIAILWNGPWHYKDMGMKNHSLLQVQTRDKIKTKLFESLGWKVLIFQDNTHTPRSAFEEIKQM